MDNVTAAKILIGLLDLTSLSDKDTDLTIQKLCARATTPYGKVAAVCVYPRFVKTAQTYLDGTGIKVATVINFPEGNRTKEKLQEELDFALEAGADEIDAVLPYKDFLSGNQDAVNQFFSVIKNRINPKKTPLKIIIESGEMPHYSQIAAATKLCIEEGATFVKTSTGKTKTSATPEAANIILETIASGKRNVGFKASGGIKTTDDAKQYLILANSIMGYKWITPKNFRIGASSLLDDLINTIERGY